MRHEGGPEKVINSVKQVINSVKQVLNTVKQVLNSVKTVIKQSYSQSNGRVNSIYSINQSRDPKTGCVPAPLGSPTGPQKRSYGTARGHRTAGSGHRGEEVYGRGMGTRVGGGGVIPGTQHAARGVLPMTAERAPEGLQGLEWVVMGRADVLGTAAVRTHPAGPVGTTPWSLPGSALIAALQPITARFDLIS